MLCKDWRVGVSWYAWNSVNCPLDVQVECVSGRTILAEGSTWRLWTRPLSPNWASREGDMGFHSSSDEWSVSARTVATSGWPALINCEV